ncbi:MAG: ATP-binding protein [Treponema sp.]|nr:MAG: ATP-binding protein [Treponema sp.]
MSGIFLGKAKEDVYLLPKMSNRHGLIAGATGTGKTITLKVIAEAFSDIGVPVFLPDVKGDLMSFCEAGSMNKEIQRRVDFFGIKDFEFTPYPIRLWDIFSELGHPVRTTISEVGPLLLSRLLRLTDAQSGVLNIAFRIADENNWLLLDIKDLKSILIYIGENSKELRLEYGNISSASVGAIQRAILTLEDEGAETFFAEPALDITDFMQVKSDGRGYINVFNAVKLYQKPSLYSTFLLWFLSELYETLPEVGDMEKPKFVFFFDEAHLLFENCSDVLIEKLEQIIRLVRSKGVGIFFITQNPADIPDKILGQLGNRIQHALRAFTPKDRKAIKLAADTFRPNPEFEVEDEITNLQTGEALISVLTDDGSPSVTQKVLMTSPHSKIGTVDNSKLQAVINESPLLYKYKDMVDRESAYEILKARFAKEAESEKKLQEAKIAEKQKRAKKRQPKSQMQKMGESMLSSFTRSVGRQVARGLLGSLKKLL